MKTLILTEGGKNIGFGHITRCLSLWQAFRERDITSELVINGDGNIKGLLKGQEYRIYDWLKEKRSGLIGNAELVIVDSYLAGIDFYKKVSEIAKIPVYIDDYKRLEYPRGIVINGGISAKKLNYPQRGSNLYLLGPQYAFLRKTFWDVKEKSISGRAKTILITCGGMDHSALADKILKRLRTRFNFCFYMVKHKQKMLSAKELLNLMMRADICISGGGQTTYELARVGVPSIGICLADNQRLSLEGWQEKGFVEYIKANNDDAMLAGLINGIDKLMPYEERARRSRIGSSCVDGKGSLRIIDHINGIVKI